MPAPDLVLCSTAPETLVQTQSTHWVLLGLLELEVPAPHPSGRVTALLLREHPTRGNTVAFTSLGDLLLQTNKLKGSQRMHSHSFKYPTSSTQHSTVPGPILQQIPVWICIQKHLLLPTSSALLTFGTLHHYLESELFQALTNSCRIQQNSWCAACHRNNLLLEAQSTRNQPACHHVPTHPAPQGVTKQPKTETSKTPAEADGHQHSGWLQNSLTHCQHLIIRPCKSNFPLPKQACTCL